MAEGILLSPDFSRSVDSIVSSKRPCVLQRKGSSKVCNFTATFMTPQCEAACQHTKTTECFKKFTALTRRKKDG